MKLQTLFFILISIPVLFGAGIVSIQMRSSLCDWRERNLSGYRVGWWVLLSLSVGLALSLNFNWFHAYDRLLGNERLSRSVPGAVLIWLAVGGFFGFVLALLTTLPTTIPAHERHSNTFRYALTVGSILFVTALLVMYVMDVSSAFR